ncbi:MAG: deaminase [Patescibacteria group bacterium]
MKKVVIAFVPVLHEGYRKFFEKHKDADPLFIFGTSLLKDRFPHLEKEIRALEPEVMKKAIESLDIFESVKILESPDGVAFDEAVLPDEDVSRELVEKYFKNKKVTFDKVFLRWDKHQSMEVRPVEVEQKISKEEFDKKVIQNLKGEAEKSSDWWRRIGAAIIKDNQVVFVSHNKHLPSEHSPYTNGDPRNNFHKGIGIELSTSIHAEASLISEVARKGIALEGASMYVTVFPCPTCAKLIATCGITKLYYSGGYTMLDQDKLLQSMGVEIIYVDMK